MAFPARLRGVLFDMDGTLSDSESLHFQAYQIVFAKELPGWSEDVLSFVPVAVLTAIIVPSVMIGMDGAPQLAGNPRLPAALFAIIVAWFSRSVLATIAGGLVAMWCLNWIGY